MTLESIDFLCANAAALDAAKVSRNPTCWLLMGTAPPDPQDLGCHCRKSPHPPPTRRVKPLFSADSSFQDHSLYSFSYRDLSDSTIPPLQYLLSNRHDWTTNNPWQLLHSGRCSTATQHHRSSQAPMRHGSRYSRHDSGHVVRRYGAKPLSSPNGRSGDKKGPYSASM